MENYIFTENVEDKDETESLADTKTYPVQVEDWEFEAGGRFLHELYKRKVISLNENGFVSKGLLIHEFKKYLDASKNKDLRERLQQRLGVFNVGNLLHRGKFLVNTKRGSGKYRINYERLFGVDMLELHDKNHLFNSQTPNDMLDNIDVENKKHKWEALEYMGTEMQAVDENKEANKKWQCTICQVNLNSLLMLRYHVQEHGVDNQSVWSKQLIKFDASIVRVSAQLAENKQRVHFQVACILENKQSLMVDRVILVKGFSLYTVPISSSATLDLGCCYFSVDVRLLNDANKHTFVLILRNQMKPNLRIAEQHNYLHKKVIAFCPIVIKDAVLNDQNTFAANETLLPYEPDEKWTKPFKNSVSIDDLKKLSPEFSDYMNNNKKLSVQNIQGTLKFLLQMEDLHRCFMGSIVQKQVTVQKNGLDYTFKITSAKNIFVEKLLIDNNQVFLRFVQGKCNDDDIDLGLGTLMQNDEKLEQILKAPNSTIYKGNIVEVSNGSIIFSSAKKIPLHQKYLIVIRPSRFHMRLQYRALEKLSQFSTLDMSRFLFPQFVRATHTDMPRPCLILHNIAIYKDAEQLQAVQNICDGPYRDDTYILEGAAGTGKTSVLIESIIQLYEKSENNKILVLADTESACDVLATPLSQLLKAKNKLGDMARVYSHMYDLNVGNEPCEEEKVLLQVSNIYSKHFYPAVADLNNKRIVVTTVRLASGLVLGGFGSNINRTPVFNYIFVDNATTITEPELLMAIINVLSPTASLILSGDRQQLGPKVYSRRASDLGLGVSLMERLLQYDCYQINKDAAIQSNSVYTRLQNNYRSHPELVDLCCHLFHYNVKPLVNITQVTLFNNWYKLLNANIPYLMHHVSDDHMQVLSDWNLGALDLLVKYLKELKYFGTADNSITDKDIGIITNYNWETKFLRDELNMRGWHGVHIDNFENFISVEKQIIFCLFSVNPDFMESIYNAKNLNTIISRAKSLIVFIGNVRALKQNVYLINLIDSCNKHKMLIMEDTTVDLKDSFESLMLHEATGGKPMLPTLMSINTQFKGATPKMNADNKKPQHAHLSHNMKKANNNMINAQTRQKHGEKLKEMMQPSKKYEQKSPIENLFENNGVVEKKKRAPTANKQPAKGQKINKNPKQNPQTVGSNQEIHTKPKPPPSYAQAQKNTNGQQQQQRHQPPPNNNVFQQQHQQRHQPPPNNNAFQQQNQQHYQPPPNNNVFQQQHQQRHQPPPNNKAFQQRNQQHHQPPPNNNVFQQRNQPPPNNNVFQQRNQPHGNNNAKNPPIQLNFQFPSVTSIPPPPVAQQIYPNVPAFPEPPPQYHPPSYEATAFRQPHQQFNEKPRTPEFATEPLFTQELQRPAHSRSQQKNGKENTNKQPECSIA